MDISKNQWRSTGGKWYVTVWSILLLLRITKPGGHLCFTHFVEPGEFIRSILQPVVKGFWLDLAKNNELLELKMKPMTNDQEIIKNSGNRYSVCFSKKK